MKKSKYFDFNIGKLHFALGSSWLLVNLEDGTSYYKLIGPLYWKITS